MRVKPKARLHRSAAGRFHTGPAHPAVNQRGLYRRRGVHAPWWMSRQGRGGRV